MRSPVWTRMWRARWPEVVKALEHVWQIWLRFFSAAAPVRGTLEDALCVEGPVVGAACWDDDEGGCWVLGSVGALLMSKARLAWGSLRRETAPWWLRPKNIEGGGRDQVFQGDCTTCNLSIQLIQTLSSYRRLLSSCPLPSVH